MVWRLEIHQIGLNGKGDATLILAINDGVGANQQAQTRSLLIDGGMGNEGRFVHLYVRSKLPGNAPLDVLVVTHYDLDHFNGVRQILNDASTPRYNHTIIFDQGYSAGSADNSYIRYCNAIARVGTRSRVTHDVNNVAPGPHTRPGNAILNSEILWTDAAGNATTPAAILGVAAGTNLNFPTVTCVAVNRYIQGAPGGPHGGQGTDLKNEHSLGFIVRFNNFKYFIAGDLEQAQEDLVMNHVNPTDTLADRVVAIHASHHGGNTSTSRAFIDRLRPDAAFISCGNANQHDHPAEEVVNIFDGYPWAANPHAPAPPPSPNRPVNYYLTGYEYISVPPNNLPGSYGHPDLSMVAGDPQANPRRPGHIVITVSRAQSENDQRGEFYFGIREATRVAALTEKAGNAAAIGAAAANAVAAAGIRTRLDAIRAAVAAAATTAGATAAVTNAATAAALLEASPAGSSGNNYDHETIARCTAAAVIAAGGSPIQAAAAGAAGGAAFGSGERDQASWATLRAVQAANPARTPLELSAACTSTAKAIAAAVGVGLFSISFYDYFRGNAPGIVNITHYG